MRKNILYALTLMWQHNLRHGGGIDNRHHHHHKKYTTAEKQKREKDRKNMSDIHYIYDNDEDDTAYILL